MRPGAASCQHGSVKALLALLLLSACPAEEPNLKIEVVYRAGDQPVELGDERPFVNGSGEAWGARRVAWFVGDVQLDGAVSLEPAWLVDSDEPGSEVLAVSAEPGSYTALTGSIGLPPELGEPGALDSLAASLMEWPVTLGGGYHYLKLEGRWEGPGGPEAFALHTGPLDGVDRSIPFSLPLDLELGEDLQRLTMTMDLAGWLDGPHPVSFADGWAGGIMSDEDRQQALFENGQDLLSVAP